MKQPGIPPEAAFDHIQLPPNSHKVTWSWGGTAAAMSLRKHTILLEDPSILLIKQIQTLSYVTATPLKNNLKI